MMEKIDIKDIWNCNEEGKWKDAEEEYSKRINQVAIIEKKFEQMTTEEILDLSPDKFYIFLRDMYFPWKFTGVYLKPRLENLKTIENKKMQIKDVIDDLKELQTRIEDKKELNDDDMSNAIRNLQKIPGIGPSAATGLLSILFPTHFGTIDKFVAINLKKVGYDISEQDCINISVENAINMENILLKKVKKMNTDMNTDYWTPRRLDKILWSIRED